MEIGSFILTLPFINHVFMHYNHFRVGPADDNYWLSISGFTGITPNDPFYSHYPIIIINGQSFTTYDRDNDGQSGVNCAVNGHGSTAPGGWWRRHCFLIKFNYNMEDLVGWYN